MKFILITVSVFLLTACNTMAGFGRDIQGSAEFVHGKMTTKNPAVQEQKE